MKKNILFFLLFMFCVSLNVKADDITLSSNITINNKYYKKYIDRDEETYNNIKVGSQLKIESEEEIASIYIEYYKEPIKGVVASDGKHINFGMFLHEYINLENSIKSNNLTLTFDDDAQISELYVLSKGDLPDYVEIWEDNKNKADLLLVSSHGDDEHLYFLGLLPTYVDRGANIQVAYFVNHNDNPIRIHEQLHGLYAVGIRNYPEFGIIPDKFSDTAIEAENNMIDAGLSKSKAIQNIVKIIRKYKPQILVTHDINGEYGHGQHKLCVKYIKFAIEDAAEETFDELSANEYGLWDIPKVYIHLYPKNKIVMDYDIPLKTFKNKTSYEVSKEGFSKHISQQTTALSKWLNGEDDSYTTASEIKEYSPCTYGLYRTLVGEDVEKNDMFENIILYKDQEVKTNVSKKKIKKEIKKVTFDITFYIGIIILFILIKIINET